MVPMDGLIASAALGLTTAASWGAGDFCGGLATRRANVYGVGIAAPVSGVLSAAVPVVAGAVLEGTPGAIRLTGFALALMAVWLVSRGDDGAFCAGDLALPVA